MRALYIVFDASSTGHAVRKVLALPDAEQRGPQRSLRVLSIGQANHCWVPGSWSLPLDHVFLFRVISPGRLPNMATTSAHPLAVLAALMICAGWNNQLYASAQFVKGGGVKGSVRGVESGNFRSFKNELGLGVSGSGGTKGFSSVKGSLSGTKGGAAMTKGGMTAFGSNGGFGSSSLSSKGFSNFVKGGFGTSSLQQGQQSAGLKSVKGSSGLKGESLKGSVLSQEFSQVKGIKGALGSQSAKGIVKSALAGDSKQSRQSFGLGGTKGGQDLFAKGSTKGGALISMLQSQQFSQVKGTKGSGGVKGITGSQFGMKGFAKGDLAQSQKQSLLGGTKGADGLKGSLKDRFPERESFNGLQSGQLSAGTKGFKGGSSSSILEQQANQKSRRLLNDGAFSLYGGDVQKSSKTKGSLKGAAVGFRRRASSFGGASSETQKSSIEHFGHRAQQSRFSSSGSSGILRSVHFQGPSGQLKHHSQQSFSSHRWVSGHAGFGASRHSFSSQRRHSGETGLTFGGQQQQQRSNKGAAFQQVGKNNLLQQSQQQMSQSGKNIGSFQRGSTQLTGIQLGGQGQRLQRQSAGVSGLSSSSKGQQQRIGQSSQSAFLSGIRKGNEAAQQAVGQNSLSASSLNQKRADLGKSRLILESGLVQDSSSGAASQQKSQRLMQSSQAAKKRSFALGSVSSDSQQKSVKGLLQQQQQQQQQVQQQRRS